MADNDPSALEQAARAAFSRVGAEIDKLDASTGATQKAFKALGAEIKANEDGVKSIIETYARYKVSTTQVAASLRGAFGDFQELALLPKEFAAAIAGGNIFAISQTEGFVKQQAQVIQDNMYRAMKRLETDVIQVGEGVPIVLNTMYKNSAQLQQSYFDNVLRESRLFAPAIEALQKENSYEMTKTTQLLTDGLRVPASAITNIYQEEFSKTGKISGEFAQKFAADVIAAEQVTGQNRMSLAEDLGKFLERVDLFGNSTNAQILALSANMSKLGLDTNDAIAVLTKFSAFDQAATSVGNLAAVTGTALDTMELFYLANSGDKLGFFQSLRQQLLDSGVAIENLSLQEQSYLQKQLGFTSVRQLQTFLNDEIEMTTENLADLIDSESDVAGLRGARLDDELAKSGGMAAKAQEAVTKADEAYQNTLRLAAASSEMARNIQQINIDAAKNVAEGGGLAIMAKGGAAIGTAMKDSSKFTAQSLSEISTAINEFVTEGNVLKLESVFTRFIPKSLPPIFADIVRGIDIAMPVIQEKILELTNGMVLVAENANDKLKFISDDTSSKIKKSFEEIKEKVFKEDEAGYAKFVEGVLTKQKDVESRISALADAADIARKTGASTEIISAGLEKAKEVKDYGLTSGQLARLAGAAEGSDRSAEIASITAEVIGRNVRSEVDQRILSEGKKPETGSGATPTPTATAPTNVNISVTPEGKMKGELTIKFDSDIIKGMIIDQVVDMAVSGFTLDGSKSAAAGFNPAGDSVRIKLEPNQAISQ